MADAWLDGQSSSTNKRKSKSAKRQFADEQRLANALDPAKGQAIIRNNDTISIRGISKPDSGPFVVVGRNFAEGTTAADIRAAIEPVCGPMLSCHVTTPRPFVVVEMIFKEREAADAAIIRFHNQVVYLHSIFALLHGEVTG